MTGKVTIYVHAMCGLSQCYMHQLKNELKDNPDKLEFIDVEQEPTRAYEEGVKTVPFVIITDGVNETRLIGFSKDTVRSIKTMIFNNNFNYKESLH